MSTPKGGAGPHCGGTEVRTQSAEHNILILKAKMPGMTLSEVANWTGEGALGPVSKYVEASRKLDLSGIAWDRIADVPLDAGARECLVYMPDIEGYTIAYLR